MSFFAIIFMFFFQILCHSDTYNLFMYLQNFEFYTIFDKIERINNDTDFVNNELRSIEADNMYASHQMFMINVLSIIYSNYLNNCLMLKKVNMPEKHYFFFNDNKMPILVNNLFEKELYLIAIQSQYPNKIKFVKYLPETNIDLHWHNEVAYYSFIGCQKANLFTYENIKNTKWYQNFKNISDYETKTVLDNLFNPIKDKIKKMDNYCEILLVKMKIEIENTDNMIKLYSSPEN